MKLAKLSLAAIVVAGLASSSFAADTLADAFKEGKVSGELKAYYFDRDYDMDGHESLFTTGILLNYKTASLYGLGANFTFQGNSSPFASTAEKALFATDEYGTGAVLSEAYLSYTLGKTTALVGRMFLDTPLFASSGSRMTKQAFEGAAVINTDLPNTTLIAGYVQKFQDRTNFEIGGMPSVVLSSGKIGEFRKFNDDGAYTLAAINKSITGLTLTAAYANVIDIIQVAYAEAAYAGKAGSFTYGLAGQYYYNNVDDALTTENNNLWGAKASLGYNDFGVYAAYSKVNDKAGGLGSVVSGLGGGADLAYTMSPINSNSYINGTKAYKVGATYAVLKNTNLGVNYTVNDIAAHLGEDAYKESWAAIEADYAFEGSLKGLSTSVIYEDGGKDANGINELWAKINYKF